MFYKILIITFFCVFFLSCDSTLRCEKHFIPSGYLGNIRIYFEQRGGQNKVDEDGCVVYIVSDDGKCFSSRRYKVGVLVPGQTFKYYEKVKSDSVTELPEFYEKEYLVDTVRNSRRKYIFFLSSGYSGDTLVYSYDVDYGANYKKHLFSKG